MSLVPKFVLTAAVNSRDGKSRVAAELYINNDPSGLYVYSKVRARAMVQRAKREGQVSKKHLRQALAAIDQLRDLPEVCSDFPAFALCHCGRHSAVIDADGEDFHMHPAYSQEVALLRLQLNLDIENITAVDYERLQAEILRSPLPPATTFNDHLAELVAERITGSLMQQLGKKGHQPNQCVLAIVPQQDIDWCHLELLASQLGLGGIDA